MVEAKVDHVKEPIPSHGAGDSLAQQAMPTESILTDNLSSDTPGHDKISPRNQKSNFQYEDIKIVAEL